MVRVVAQCLLQARFFGECRSERCFIGEQPFHRRLRCGWAVGQALRQGQRVGRKFIRRYGSVNQTPLRRGSSVEPVAQQGQRFGTCLPHQPR